MDYKVVVGFCAQLTFGKSLFPEILPRDDARDHGLGVPHEEAAHHRHGQEKAVGSSRATGRRASAA